MLFCTASEHKCNGRKSERAQQKKLPASVRFENPLGMIIVAISITRNVIVASRQPEPISHKLNFLNLFQVLFRGQLFRNLVRFCHCLRCYKIWGEATLHLVDVNGLHTNIMWFVGYCAQTRPIRSPASEGRV